MKKLILTAFVLSCLFTSTAQRSQQTDTLRIIDAHTHTDFSGDPERTSGIPKTAAQYFKEWDEAGVVGAVAHVSPRGEGLQNLKARNVVYCAAAGSPRR